MRLAIAEIRRAKLRFGLLTGAVALLVFLILFQQTLAAGLLSSFTGGLENRGADVLVLNADARGAVEGSVVTPEQVEAVRGVDGVAAAGPLGEGTFTVEAGGEIQDATVFGWVPGEPGEPTGVAEGRLPERDGEAVASEADADLGFGVGDRVRVLPGDVELEIVGVASDARFSVQPTVTTTFATYERIVAAANPDAPIVLPALVAVRTDEGADPVAVAAAIDEAVDGIDAADVATAVEQLPGVDSITQSFAVILLLAFIVVVLVTWVFFLILTVQKTSSLTLLRAVGASTRYLLVNIAAQVTIVTVAGITVAAALLWFATRSGSGGLDVTVDPGLVLRTGGTILVLALFASIASMRRVARLDPFAATRRQAAGGLA